MQKIPKAVLEALEKWRKEHEFSHTVISRLAESEPTASSVYDAAMREFRILRRLLLKHELNPDILPLQEGEQERYRSYLKEFRAGKGTGILRRKR